MGGKKRLFRHKALRHSHPAPDSSKHGSAVKHAEHPHTGKSAAEEIKEEIREEISSLRKRHIYKRILKIHHDFPPGIVLLLAFSGVIGLMYLVLASMFSFTIVFGAVIQGAASRLLNIIMILVIAFMVFGISKKKIWAYHLALWVFSFVILNSILSMFFIKKNVSGVMTLFVTLSFFFMLMMNLITLWYIKTKKDYFLHHYHPSHMTKDDKKFIYGLTALWLVFLFTAGILGNAFYSETTKKADSLISELYSVYPYSVKDYCMQKVEDRDLCLLTAAVMYERLINSNSLCREIDSEFYKYTCFKAMQGDLA